MGPNKYRLELDPVKFLLKNPQWVFCKSNLNQLKNALKHHDLDESNVVSSTSLNNPNEITTSTGISPDSGEEFVEDPDTNRSEDESTPNGTAGLFNTIINIMNLNIPNSDKPEENTTESGDLDKTNGEINVDTNDNGGNSETNINGGQESALNISKPNVEDTILTPTHVDLKKWNIHQQSMDLVTVDQIDEDCYLVPCNQKRLIDIIKGNRDRCMYRDLVKSGYNPCIIHNPPASIQQNALVVKLDRPYPENCVIFGWNTEIKGKEYTFKGEITDGNFKAESTITYTMSEV